jgi:hypothetical protein
MYRKKYEWNIGTYIYIERERELRRTVVACELQTIEGRKERKEGRKERHKNDEEKEGGKGRKKGRKEGRKEIPASCWLARS